MSEPQTPTNPPQFGCLWVGLLLLLVVALIGYGMCSNLSLGSH